MMAKSTHQAPRRLEHLHRDRGYRWTDRDPVLEDLTRLITDSGHAITWVSERSGVSQTTISNWLSGKTKQPRNITVDAVLHALGFRRRIELG